MSSSKEKAREMPDRLKRKRENLALHEGLKGERVQLRLALHLRVVAEN